MTTKYIELILNANIKHLGKSGTMAKVPLGYARNYLLPQNQAALVTENKLKQIQAAQKKHIILKQEKQKQFLLLQNTIQRINKFTIRRKSNPTGQIFGSVSDKDIYELIFITTGQKIEKNQILLPDIKYIGNYMIDIQLIDQIQLIIQLQILPDIKF